MTKEEFGKLLVHITDVVEKDNDTEVNMENLKSAQDACDALNDSIAEGENWKAQFEDMKRKYKERFFNTVDGAIADQLEDNAEDTAENRDELTIDDLFVKREGDYKKEDK